MDCNDTRSHLLMGHGDWARAWEPGGATLDRPEALTAFRLRAGVVELLPDEAVRWDDGSDPGLASVWGRPLGYALDADGEAWRVNTVGAAGQGAASRIERFTAGTWGRDAFWEWPPGGLVGLAIIEKGGRPWLVVSDLKLGCLWLLDQRSSRRRRVRVNLAGAEGLLPWDMQSLGGSDLLVLVRAEDRSGLLRVDLAGVATSAGKPTEQEVVPSEFYELPGLAQAMTRGGRPRSALLLTRLDTGWALVDMDVDPLATRGAPSPVRVFGAEWTPIDVAWAGDGAALLPPGATPEDQRALEGPALVMVGADGSARAFKEIGQGWEEQRVQLPMTAYTGRDLVQVDGEVYYEAWVGEAAVHIYGGGALPNRRSGLSPLVAWPPRAHRAEGTLILPRLEADLPGCVWHRLVLEAEIPTGARVQVKSRAADEPQDLDGMTWLDEPAFVRQWRVDLPGVRPLAPTWELLLQRAHGRYLDLRLVLSGGAAGTPRLRSLRVTSPRFSYLRAYMPEVWRRESGPGSFAERLLANVEGWLTAVEDQVAASQLLFDPRTSPPELLAWLAGWVGISDAERWDPQRLRLLLGNAARLFAWRGTRRGVMTALHLALDDAPDPSIFEREDWSPRENDTLVLEARPWHASMDPWKARLRVLHALDAPRRDVAETVLRAELPAYVTFEISDEE